MAELYQEQPYLRTGKGTVVAAFEDENGHFCIALRDSIFYPQGGGQKGDRGSLGVNGLHHNVVDTIKDVFSSDGRSLCVLDHPAQEVAQGQEVLMEIDWHHRYSQMRLHSIVHLHHCVMEQIAAQSLPVPVTSDLSSEGTAYNRYETATVSERIAADAFEKMKALIKQGAPIQTHDDLVRPGYRYWECLGFKVPCGGTHLNDIREIGEFGMAFSRKKDKPKVAFVLL